MPSDLQTRAKHSSATTVVLKQSAQSLIILVGHAVNAFAPSNEVASNGEALGDLVSLLLDIITARGVGVSENDDIARAAQSVMGQVLRVMPATHFIGAVQSTLESGDDKVCGPHLSTMCTSDLMVPGSD